ncbi:hypothetical protein AtDm6_1926 [Acetobacter tropicalis]|uniref:Uncharacterized protein n=1 Tax=Acetobacter tropicalis TaxID=104102 RepID=A0A094YNU6_9PROT|nr:hypothetical protein AtDm6_1926 [Acetobacter tropicalis]
MSVTEHMAVAVNPPRPPSPAEEMTFTDAPTLAIAARNSS